MLHTVEAATAQIATGRPLHIAGDEAVLSRLPRGNWIGGTIPYFVLDSGCTEDRSRVFVSPLPEEVTETRIEFVAADDLDGIIGRAPEHGYTTIIIPAGSDAHTRFAIDAWNLSGNFATPLIGWIAGVHLNELGQAKPKVVNGLTGEAVDNMIVVMHATLPLGTEARIGIINQFAQGAGATLVFPATGFEADACTVNGDPGSLSAYVREHDLDLRLPLVADMNGEQINVSFQVVDNAAGVVRFYAPVLAGVEYRQAVRITTPAQSPAGAAFSCNCILNYLNGAGEVPVTGPATFGEIAFVLLNQTGVFLDLVRA